MTITNPFSKRQKVLRKEVPDAYEYAQIPGPLRVQIVHILRDLFGHPVGYDMNGCREAFGKIEELLCREYGLFLLGDNPMDTEETPDVRVINFLLAEKDYQRVLDVVETAFRFLEAALPTSPEWQSRVPKDKFDRAKAELNARFREHGIGYQYESGQIVRVDSHFLHAEVVKPTLDLLTAPEYAEANAELLKAFEHYRRGDSRKCLNECLKAFESAMKAICTKRNWPFNPTDTASELIDVCLKNELIPQLLHSHIGGVRATLKSGVPTIRYRLSGHRPGEQVVDVPLHYASYMLHLTATAIQFLAESEKALE